MWRRSVRSLAVGLRQQPPAGHGVADRLQQRGDPAAGEQLGPAAQPGTERVEEVVVGRASCCGRQPTKAVRAAPRARPARCGCSSALSSGEPVARRPRTGTRWSCRSGRRERRRRPGRRGRRPPPCCVWTSTATSPGSSGRRRPPLRRQCAAGRRCRRRRRRRRRRRTVRDRACVLARRDGVRSRAHTRIRSGASPGLSRAPGVRGLDRADDDAVVAQRGAAETPSKRVEQRLVAAPVGAERRRGRRRPRRRPEVGDDVGAAEGVDRLLRVADQHQRAVAVEGALAGSPTAPGRCPGTRRRARPGSGCGSAPARLPGLGVGQRVAQLRSSRSS